MKYWWLILLLVPFVLAECVDGEVCAVEETKGFFPESFDYLGGDYSVVDWNKVQWNQIPPERVKDIPPDRLVYGQLDRGQKLSMTPEQIKFNFGKIEDLNKEVDKKAATQAIRGAFGVDFTHMDGDAKIKGSTLRSGMSQKLDLNSEVARSGTIYVTTGDAIVINPKKDVTEVSKGDYFLIFVEDKKLLGNTISDFSNIRVRNGFLYTKRVIINGVQFNSLNQEEFEVYQSQKEFDEDKEEAHGVYFSDQGFKVKTRYNDERKEEDNFFGGGVNPITVTFKESKKMPPGLEEERSFTVEIGDESEFEYRRRSGAIPLITYDNKVEITNGKLFFINEEGKEKISEIRFRTNTPFSIPVAIANGDKRTVFDGNNNFLRTDVNQEKLFECTTCALDFNKGDLAFNHARGYLKKETGINVEGAKDVESLNKLQEKIEELPPAVRDSIKKINLVDDVRSHCGEKTGGCMNMGTRTMTVPKNPSSRILAHEAGHSFHAELNEKDRKAQQNTLTLHYKRLLEKKYGVELVVQDGKLIEREYKGLVTNKPRYNDGRFYSVKFEELGYVDYSPAPITDEEAGEFKKLYDSDKTETFEDQWTKAAKIDGHLPYGVGLGPKVVQGRNAEEWARLSTEKRSFGPKNGCTTAYGCNNIREDIAEHVECAQDACYIELVHEEGGKYQPGSQEYKIHCSKFKILCDKGGISEETCDDITTMCSR